MKRNIEINDTLPEILSALQTDVTWALKCWIHDNAKDQVLAGETINTPCMQSDLNYSGQIDEAIDGAVPVYYSEIDGLWYLYKEDFIEAYENMSIGEDPTENSGTTAIYCYLAQRLNDWYHENAEELTELICADIKAGGVCS